MLNYVLANETLWEGLRCNGGVCTLVMFHHHQLVGRAEMGGAYGIDLFCS